MNPSLLLHPRVVTFLNGCWSPRKKSIKKNTKSVDKSSWWKHKKRNWNLRTKGNQRGQSSLSKPGESMERKGTTPNISFANKTNQPVTPATLQAIPLFGTQVWLQKETSVGLTPLGPLGLVQVAAIGEYNPPRVCPTTLYNGKPLDLGPGHLNSTIATCTIHHSPRIRSKIGDLKVAARSLNRRGSDNRIHILGILKHNLESTIPEKCCCNKDIPEVGGIGDDNRIKELRPSANSNLQAGIGESKETGDNNGPRGSCSL
ncbi:hypothetical protein LIER_34681 [Lithospermum erythrorhizon]|uniref:Uncharacterized protein n=1 Tax=Lithospermum erythrorhizon TaxID=34254 RepID=A0AAV3S087_LITER